jgi:hypothetical protein
MILCLHLFHPAAVGVIIIVAGLPTSHTAERPCLSVGMRMKVADDLQVRE